MIKDVFPSSTSAIVAGAYGKVPKEAQMVEEKPIEMGSFGLVLQSVQQIKEESQPKGEVLDEAEEPVVGVETNELDNEGKKITQEAPISEPIAKDEQYPQATENVVKMKQSAAKVAKNPLQDNKNVVTVENESQVQIKNNDSTQAESEIVEEVPRSSTTEQAVIKKAIKPQPSVPKVETNRMEGVTEVAVKVESSAFSNTALASTQEQRINVGATEIDSMESPVVVEKNMGIHVVHETMEAPKEGLSKKVEAAVKVESSTSSNTALASTQEQRMNVGAAEIDSMENPVVVEKNMGIHVVHETMEAPKEGLSKKVEAAVKVESSTSSNTALASTQEQRMNVGATEIDSMESPLVAEKKLDVQVVPETVEVPKEGLSKKVEAAVKVENSIPQKAALSFTQEQRMNVGAAEIDSMESPEVTEKKLDIQVELGVAEVQKEGNQIQELEKFSSGSTKSKQVTGALKDLDEPLQKAITLKEKLNQKVEEAVREVESDTVVEKLTTAKPAEGTIEFTNALSNSKAEENRAKRYRQQHYSTERGANTGDRLTLITDQSAARTPTNQGYEFSNLRAVNPTSMQTDSGFNLTKDQEMLLKEQIIESIEINEFKNNYHYNMGYLRSGEIPVSNLSIRNNVLPSLTQIMRASSQGKGIPETWQKHNFELEDGNKIQLSTRNVDGLIQVKLASSSLELSKLLQMHGQDIKNHLEQECELNIDLQFDSQPDQSMNNFFGDTSGSPQSHRRSSGIEANSRDGKQTVEQPIQQSVRKFGYNQMEWTV